MNDVIRETDLNFVYTTGPRARKEFDGPLEVHW